MNDKSAMSEVSITRLVSSDSGFDEQLSNILAWDEAADHRVHEVVKDILSQGIVLDW